MQDIESKINMSNEIQGIFVCELNSACTFVIHVICRYCFITTQASSYTLVVLPVHSFVQFVIVS